MNLTDWCQKLWNPKYDFKHDARIKLSNWNDLGEIFSKKNEKHYVIFYVTHEGKEIKYRGLVSSVSSHGGTDLNGYFRIRFSQIERKQKNKKEPWQIILEDRVTLPWSDLTSMEGKPWANDSKQAKLANFAVLIVGWNENIIGSESSINPSEFGGSFRCWPHDFLEYALGCFAHQGHMPDSKYK